MPLAVVKDLGQWLVVVTAVKDLGQCSLIFHDPLQYSWLAIVTAVEDIVPLADFRALDPRLYQLRAFYKCHYHQSVLLA